jgi:predicted DNA binding protein
VLAIDFSIYHQGCPACESTERFPGVDMRILSSTPYGSSKASVLQYAGSPVKGEVARFLDYWRDHSAVIRLNVAEKAGRSAVFNVSLESQSGWVTKAILDNDAVYSGPISVREGVEHWSVLVNEENKTSLLQQLDAVGVVKVDRIERVNLRDILATRQAPEPDLSPRQLLVLKTAYDEGYFDSPRRTSSRELATRLGLAQSTLLEHLRKAQSKLLQRTFATRDEQHTA